MEELAGFVCLGSLVASDKKEIWASTAAYNAWSLVMMTTTRTIQIAGLVHCHPKPPFLRKSLESHWIPSNHCCCGFSKTSSLAFPPNGIPMTFPLVLLLRTPFRPANWNSSRVPTIVVCVAVSSWVFEQTVCHGASVSEVLS